MEELQIHGALPGRKESPTIERFARLAVEKAFGDLIGEKYLYQKTEVVLTGLQSALEGKGLKDASAKWSDFQKEIASRPWWLLTRHLGDDPNVGHVNFVGRGGVPPGALGGQIEDMPIGFYAPSCQLQCRKCKGPRAFVALSGSGGFVFDSPYPRKTQAGTEQVFQAFYRCEICRESIHTVLVRREGLKLHLSGFAPRKETRLEGTVPKEVEDIFADAYNAVAEGDVHAGIYHLRTALEHFLKAGLGVPIDQQIRADELVEKHNATVSAALRATLPSMGETMSRLSDALHTRKGDVASFNREAQRICDYAEGLRLLAKYSKLA